MVYSEVKKSDQEVGDDTQDTITDVPTTSKPLSKEDKIGFVILVLLYSIQGISQTFFARTIPMLFIEHGAHLSDLGSLSLVVMPFSFKFLVAPIMDTYFFKSFGKRKTYIIPMQYLFAGLAILMSNHLLKEIRELKVLPVLILGTLSNTIMAIQDVAVDGWAITILSQENVAYGALAQTVGLVIGGIIAFNVFIPLNSISFCNQYIFSTPQDTPLISIEGFWMWTGIITLIITFLVQFFKKEKPSAAEEVYTVWDIVKTLRSFVKNPNLRTLVLVMITGNITVAPIYSIADTKLLQNGFSKETLTNISTALIPLQMIISVLVSRICKKKKEMRVKFWSFVIGYFNFAFMFIFVLNFNKNENYGTTFIFVIISSIIMTITFTGHFISNSAYSNRICDESISGTFLTTFAALANLGSIWPRSISLYLNEYIPWEYMGIFSLVFTPIYFLWYKKKLAILHTKTAEDFTVKSPNKFE